MTDSVSDRLAMAAFPAMNPGPVVRTDLDGRIQLVNDAAGQVFEHRPLLGERWPTVCPQLDLQVWDRVLAGEDGLTQDVEIGDRCYSLVYRRPAEVHAVFIFGSDVTGLKRAHQLLMEQQAQIAEMARFPDMNPGPVLRAGRDGRIVLANAAARDLFGGDALVGQCWTDLCPGLDTTAWVGILESTDVVTVEATLARRCYLMTHRVNPDHTLVFIYGNDVTALRATEVALRQAEKMATLGNLTAGVAHELNNPAAAAASDAAQLDAATRSLFRTGVALSRIDTFGGRDAALLALADPSAVTSPAGDLSAMRRADLEAEIDALLEEYGTADAWELAPAFVAAGYTAADVARLAAEWGADRAVVLEWLGRTLVVRNLSANIGDSTRRVSNIVGTLKSYTFLDRAPVQMVDVVRGLEDTLTLFGRLTECGIEIVRDYADGVPPIEASGSDLNQVWSNLIHNAVDAMHGQGRLLVRVRSEGEDVVVEIEDNGEGVPIELQPKIFDAFVTSKPPGQGTGLGLATVWNVVTTVHGGTITFESEPGCTCFMVRLPKRLQTPLDTRSA